jgi:D-alanyl-D-alanine carboxypeptidase
MKMICRLIIIFLFINNVQAQTAQITRVQHLLDSLQVAGNFPGMSMAFVGADNTAVSLVAGYNDKEKAIKLKTTDMLMQGSVGKTYVSAIAMQLIQQKKLNLDEKVSTYLGSYSWFSRIPNAAYITIRMIMNHTSGVMRYEFKEQFTKDLTANPGKSWKPEELLSYILDEKASFPAGEGWEYSDTNYILLGMIIEKLTGATYYNLLRKNLLEPLRLQHTAASDKRKLPGLSQGYAGDKNEFGGKDKVIDEEGNFIINPQFEWTGGGIYSTTTDLAQWGKYLYEGKAFDSTLLPMMLNGVPAKLGRDTKYGLGVILRNTPIGVAHGHSGFFPGYMTEMLYFPNYRLCVALQVNSSDFAHLKANMVRCLLLLSAAIVEK